MIPTIELDQESFQEIFEKARKRIPILFPEWTNFNENDSGIALLELMSWLKEMQEYHMNQIGPEHLKTYLKLLGMKQKAMHPASGVVRCYQVKEEQCLPAGSPFAAGEVEFESLEDVWLYDGRLVRLTCRDCREEQTRERSVQQERVNLSLSIFGTAPAIGNTLELIFDRPLRAGKVYSFYCGIKEHETVKRNPITEEFLPLTEIEIEYEAEAGWQSCLQVRDDTKAFLQSGILQIQIPESQADAGREREEYRLRIRFSAGEYDAAPVLEYLDLNPVELIQCRTMSEPRLLGEGDGFPNQKYPVGFDGVVKASVEIMAEDPEHPGSYENWTRVEDFLASKPEDRHYLVDEETDMICFGDSIRGMAPEGQILLVHAAQSKGSSGNVKKGQIHPLALTEEAEVPFQAVNEENVVDGAEAESLEACFDRFQRELLEHEYAVTEEDYENLVCQTPGLMIEKAKVVKADLDRNGIYVAVKPWSDQRCSDLSQAYHDNIMRYMNSRRLIGTGLHIMKPEYIHIYLYLDLELLAYYRNTEQKIREDLNRFFQESQAEFGKPVLYSSLYGFLDSMQSVKRVNSLTIDAGGQGIGRNMGGDVVLPPNGLAILEQIHCNVSYTG